MREGRIIEGMLGTIIILVEIVFVDDFDIIIVVVLCSNSSGSGFHVINIPF